MLIVPQGVSLMCSTPNAAEFIERAGRTCYKSEDKITPESSSKFIRMLLDRGHESVIEHAHASFLVICDRGVSHEFVRHRIFSYSQESTRYCNYSKDKFGGEINVIEPPMYTEVGRMAWCRSVETAEEEYLAMLAAGESPQIARSILPNCLKTELVMTANFREWKHFLKLRTDKAAHPQMREVALMVKDILAEKCPFIFKDPQ